jgi:hypothetical protein
MLGNELCLPKWELDKDKDGKMITGEFCSYKLQLVRLGNPGRTVLVGALHCCQILLKLLRAHAFIKITA